MKKKKQANPSRIATEHDRVVAVFVDANTLPFADATVQSLLKNSVVCAKVIIVIADACELKTAEIGISLDSDIPVQMVRPVKFAEMVDKLSKQSVSAGLFVAMPGIDVPFAWDARLDRVAHADPTVGTVSPCCSGSVDFGILSANVDSSDLDNDRLDRLAFCIGDRSYHETSSCFPHCFFISHAGLHVIAAMPIPERSVPNTWAGRIAERGLLHVISPNVSVLKRRGAWQDATERNLDIMTLGQRHAAFRSGTSIEEAYRSGVDFKVLPGLDAKPVQLHVLHDLGGGASKWVADYCSADFQRINLVLKPHTKNQAFGEGIALYADVSDTVPLMFWRFASPITATVASHLEYRAAIEEIIKSCGVDAVIVSSFIGHSLDILNTGLPTVIVGHDFYPFCPAIFLYYRGICESCSPDRLKDCSDHNAEFNIAPSFKAAERLSVRDRFLSLIEKNKITIVSPTPSMERHLAVIERRFKAIIFAGIPHGSRSNFSPVEFETSPIQSSERLRIILLGQLSVGKGANLLRDSFDEITKFAEIFLVGSGELGELYKGKPGIHVVPNYELSELPGIVEKIKPHVGLLLSIRLETFSYTLSELTELGVPVAATKLGSFQDRIVDGETGYLFEPTAGALINVLRAIDGDRARLAEVRGRVLKLPRRTIADMVADYHKLIPLEQRQYARYVLNSGPIMQSSSRTSSRSEALISNSLVQADMWKEQKRLNLLLSLKEDILRQSETAQFQLNRLLDERTRAWTESQDALRRQVAQLTQQNSETESRAASEAVQRDSQLALLNKQVVWQDQQLQLRAQEISQSIEQLTSRDERLAEQENELGRINQLLRQSQDNLVIRTSALETIKGTLRMREDELVSKEEKLAQSAGLIRQQTQQLDEKETVIRYKEGKISEIYASTSWRITGPMRWVGFKVRKLKILARCLRPLAKQPMKAPRELLNLYRIWQSSGMLALKLSLVRLPVSGLTSDAQRQSKPKFDLDIKPALQERIGKMRSQPLISILMPTYNTPENMLRDAIRSVKDQLYQNWELCIADDGSPQPHVARILKSFASKDTRIKLYLGKENRGVSHASNMALKLATGEFTVLLDHDDLYEEQALFRVAECILEDDPDMVYSDEILMSGDGTVLKEHVFRPAFSPELLRSHPYIVHLVGFRTQILRDLGGFDEKLRISQDYDLILRVAEKSRKIVHIPEVLYCWRIHENSAGHQKMNQVMEVSKSVLARHLARCEEQGVVMDGPGFNFFDIRYPLRKDLKVAIIIPTKNRCDLVRQCVESVEKTVHSICYDIVVVDHASDEPESVEYFESLKGRATVLRYEGSFNFSTINNWAISKLDESYTHYLLCNNDIEAIRPGWLERMAELCQRPAVGIVGAKLFYGDRKTIQHAGVCVGAFGRAEHYGKFACLPQDVLVPGHLGALVINHEVAAVTAACLLIKREAFHEIGGFDEKIAVGFGDVDLCLRVLGAGYRILFCPYAELIHYESVTRGISNEDNHPDDTAYFLHKWKSFLENTDPYFNPNLSLVSTTWDIRLPVTHEVNICRRVYSIDLKNEKQEISYSRYLHQ